MAAITFDTHFFIKKLTSQGMPEKQAEAVIDVIREAKEHDLNVVATKEDIHLVKEDIHLVKEDIQLVKEDIQLVKEDIQLVKADIRELELRLENKIMESKVTLIQWMIGLLFLQAGLIITVIKFLH